MLHESEPENPRKGDAMETVERFSGWEGAGARRRLEQARSRERRPHVGAGCEWPTSTGLTAPGWPWTRAEAVSSGCRCPARRAMLTLAEAVPVRGGGIRETPTSCSVSPRT